VHDVATRCVGAWGKGSVIVDATQQTMHEATLLQLNCQKAAERLQWHPRWKYETTIDRTIRWYRGLHDGVPAEQLVNADINDYVAAE